MNKFICSAFAAALSLSAYSVTAATTSPGDDASNLGTKNTPQQLEQSSGAASKSDHKGMSHRNRMHRSHMDMKMMGTNGDGMLSKDKYMSYHEHSYGKMKLTNGMIRA